MTTKKTAPAEAETTPEDLAAAQLQADHAIRVADLRERFGDQVTLYPLPDVWISGVPHAEQTVDVERADELLGYFPPAFTTVKPADVAEPDAINLETEPTVDAGATPQEA